MSAPWFHAVQSQYAAALDMLANAMAACPEAVWSDSREPVERRFWYVAFHTVFWTDYYVSDDEHGYRPPAPFTLGELDPAGVYPATPYTPGELAAFLEGTRGRLRSALAGLTETRAAERCGFSFHDKSVLELHVYNLRHIQHHVGQLQWVLRQHGVEPPRWVGRGQV